jgi:hypothetical protein
MDQPRNGADSQPDDEPARWMTFAELAAVRGISKDSAITLVRRHRWRRQRDNQGHVIALVPLTWTEKENESRADNPPLSQPDGRPDTTAAEVLTGAVAALEGSVSALRERAQAAERRAETAERRADAVEAERREAITLVEQTIAMLSEERGRAERVEAAIAAERQRSDSLRERLEAAEAEAREAQQTAEELRRADEARKGSGRWARLRAAWRGE